MRLDLWLVRGGYFKTRSRAKIAIKKGMIKVNGVVITKPSAEINEGDKIEVLADKPRGYWKLKQLDEKFGIFKGGEIVLDLGSSAGGFLLYASEKAKFVYGIEFSREFEETLKELESLENVKIFIEDAFKFDLSKIESVDIILNDLTLPFASSMTALKRFLPKLKPEGRILFVHKLSKKDEPNFSDFEILAQEKSKEKREIYYLLKLRSD
ncbi:MAG: S4 domain-containing protein [Archaeoglobaceae archaeon]|nr:S4 domain-containing protein [Archaeoglobaceae archaeon]MDW8118141.1 S4 domain-containing protein [Archaeoglobaceae archaeon]